MKVSSDAECMFSAVGGDSVIPIVSNSKTYKVRVNKIQIQVAAVNFLFAARKRKEKKDIIKKLMNEKIKQLLKLFSNCKN